MADNGSWQARKRLRTTIVAGQIGAWRNKP